MTNAPSPEIRRLPKTSPLSATTAIALSIALGLIGGYLDLAIMVFKKSVLNEERTFGTGSDFPWSVPAGHLVLLLVPGLILAAINRIHPRTISLRGGAWLLTTLALWSALLRLPLYGACTLLLAAGLARMLIPAISVLVVPQQRNGRRILAAILGVLVLSAALSSGARAFREHRAVATLPAPPSSARNVLLIVWDTVRASSLSLYGYPRDTTPNLVRWARQGVRYEQALAPAPWTFPSHACFMTGQWPYQLNAQWNHTLDASVRTLAEHLARHGYQTAGFAANTNYCSYETGLDRGFAHYEDYPLTPQSLLSRTAGGNWILRSLVSRGDFYDQKWINIQSRDARGINDAFLGWLGRRRQDRPFFAFLNYFDAHDPYLPPQNYVGRFGIRPDAPRDYQFLLEFSQNKSTISMRDLVLARDCYDDCIAFLDDELARLLENLQNQGLLDNTLVVITSDHGESFGTHGLFGHGGSLFLDEVAVPLVVLSPGAPANRVVNQPVTLRDLPATVLDQVGLSAGSPFSGRSLAALWRSSPQQTNPETTLALSEMAPATAVEALARAGMSPRFQLSLVASGSHYIRDGAGSEQIYDLRRDPFETANIAGHPESRQVLEGFRRTLLKVLTEDPGAIEVENACLRSYRERLEALVQANPVVTGSNSTPEE